MTEAVDHPPHYADGWSNGAEVIDITENLNFNRGNAVKYISRAGKKNADTEIEDLQKAQWYLERELYRLGALGPLKDNALDVKMAAEVQYIFNVTDLDEALAAGSWSNPKFYESLREVPPGTSVRDATGMYWSGEGVYGSDCYDKHGPFTDIGETE